MKALLSLLTALVLSCGSAFSASISWGTEADAFVNHTGSTISTGSAFLFLVETNARNIPSFDNGAWSLNGATMIGATSDLSQGYVDVTTTVDYNTQYKPGENSGYQYVMIITSGIGGTCLPSQKGGTTRSIQLRW